MGLARRPFFCDKPYLRSLLRDRNGCETPPCWKDLHTEDSAEHVLGKMVVVDVFLVVVVGGEVVVVEVVNEGYLMEVEMAED